MRAMYRKCYIELILLAPHLLEDKPTRVPAQIEESGTAAPPTPPKPANP
jgi:hypothetical protein